MYPTVKDAAAKCFEINPNKQERSHYAMLSTVRVKYYLQYPEYDIKPYCLLYQVLNGKQTDDAGQINYM